MLVALLIALIAATAGAGPEERWLRHDRGKRTGKQSMAASGHSIAFRTPAGDWHIRSVLVCGARYGRPAPFSLAICNGKLVPLTEARPNTSLFREGAFTWAELPLDRPIAAPKSFRVVVDFRPTRAQGVYVGYGDIGKSHSTYARPRGKEHRFAKGKEWMIRVRLSRSNEPLPRRRKLANELATRSVPELAAGTLGDTLARFARAARVPVILDPALAADRKTGAHAAGVAADVLQRLHPADLRWGVVFVATRKRLEELPRGVPVFTTPGRSGLNKPFGGASIAINAHLARRRVTLDFEGVPLETAVRHVADWLQFEVCWRPGTDRTQKVTIHAADLFGWHALCVLLIPRELTYVVERNALIVRPR
ncbi:MAG: hypothetical protein V3T86_05790 [Planctomycetota bacterium]